MAKTEWSLDEDGITIKWIMQYYGNTSEDLNIKWTEIEKYKDLSGGYYLFKIYLKNGDVIKFGHGGMFLICDFNKFYDRFEEMFIMNKHPEQWAKYYKKKVS